MIAFNMEKFLRNNLLSVKEVADKTKIDLQTIYNARNKKRIKPENLKKIVKVFPDANNHIYYKERQK